MKANKIAKFLISNCKSLEKFESYMFGSYLKSAGKDIDILIVGSAGPALTILKQELRIAAEELPLDILYMQPCEAFETDFIDQQGCVSLEKMANSMMEYK